MYESSDLKKGIVKVGEFSQGFGTPFCGLVGLAYEKPDATLQLNKGNYDCSDYTVCLFIIFYNLMAW